tara:strand:- start:258 stop:365 length:108 start_codon:yes stop_codon:yes gene_type:complete
VEKKPRAAPVPAPVPVTLEIAPEAAASEHPAPVVS